MRIRASKALFIKLGERGRWESECLAAGTLRFGYNEIPHEVCVTHNWKEVGRLAMGFSPNKGVAKSHVTQVRHFYEADENVLWITFHADRLWWCFSEQKIGLQTNNDKLREAVGGWKDADINGDRLLKGNLSGRLLAVQGFKGTICTVSELDYLLHKINGTVVPHVSRAQAAFENLQAALVPIVKDLHWKDFEILTDLVFRQGGWQRVGVSGGTEKDIDLDLISPVTGERIAVQVKSKASPKDWRAYREKYADMKGFSRFYFVTHSQNARLIEEAAGSDDSEFIFWGVDQLAAQAIRGGLTGWLLDKAA